MNLQYQDTERRLRTLFEAGPRLGWTRVVLALTRFESSILPEGIVGMRQRGLTAGRAWARLRPNKPTLVVSVATHGYDVNLDFSKNSSLGIPALKFTSRMGLGEPFFRT